MFGERKGENQNAKFVTGTKKAGNGFNNKQWKKDYLKSVVTEARLEVEGFANHGMLGVPTMDNTFNISKPL